MKIGVLKWVLVQSYIARAVSMVADLRNGEKVSSRQYNALLKALESAGREDTAAMLATVWHDTKREIGHG